MDHGFSEVISKTKVFELHEKFFQLPFQATKCKLAGEEQEKIQRLSFCFAILFPKCVFNPLYKLTKM